MRSHEFRSAGGWGGFDGGGLAGFVQTDGLEGGGVGEEATEGREL
jgi:hypothetical protein